MARPVTSEADPKKARLVAFAGLDGAGKTTQCRRLARWLSECGHDVRQHAPEGPSFVRGVLTAMASEDGHADYTAILGPDRTRLVNAFVRYHAWSQTVLPDLHDTGIVLTDRFTACHYASVRASGGTIEGLLRRVFTPLPTPDLIFYLAVPPQEAHRRIVARGGDEQSLAFLTAYDAAYRSLPEFSSFVVVDGTGPADTVQARLRERLVQRFPSLRN